jgi:single-stranded DNA-binding protein
MFHLKNTSIMNHKNELTLEGIVANDPKMTDFESGNNYLSLSIMTVSVSVDQLTKVSSDTKTFHNVRVYNGEIAKYQSLKKGDQVGIKASAVSGSWIDPNSNQRRYTYYFVATKRYEVK